MEMPCGKIIVVEDDLDLQESILEYLHIENFVAEGASCTLDCYKTLTGDEFDIAVVDLNLPDGNGLDLVEHLRSHTKLGIIILTARSGMTEKIRGYHCGADYFFVKPVDLRELRAAINNLLCRLGRSSENCSEAEHGLGWRLEQHRWILTSPQQKQVEVTSKEMILLQELVAETGKAVSRRLLLQRLNYPLEGPYGNRALDVLVTRLRKKIKNETGEMPIRTVHSVGYSFSEPCRQS